MRYLQHIYNTCDLDLSTMRMRDLRCGQCTGLLQFDPKNLPDQAEEFAEFLLLTGQSHVDVATKCSLLKRSCKKKFLQK